MSQDEEIAALRAQVAEKDKEIAELRRSADRADQWFQAQAQKRALETFQGTLAKQRSRAEQHHQVVMTRRHLPRMAVSDPNEGHVYYNEAVAKIAAGYQECFGKDAPDIASDDEYGKNPMASVEGERGDLTEKEQTDVRRHFARHQSFQRGMIRIDNDIRHATARIEERLSRLQATRTAEDEGRD